MSTQTPGSLESMPTDEAAVRALYRRLLDAWNARGADAFAELFAEDGESIGFDGSQLSGRAEIATELGRIFADHPTAAYVAKVRSVRVLAPTVALLRAVAGMVAPGRSELNPAVNALHTLIATRREEQWNVTLFQNTPAQFHGRPELVPQLTAELSQLL
jgi:uncharacterized protein (TIGR02246 family)